MDGSDLDWLPAFAPVDFEESLDHADDLPVVMLVPIHSLSRIPAVEVAALVGRDVANQDNFGRIVKNNGFWVI